MTRYLDEQQHLIPRTARKVWRCIECGTLIQKGDRYVEYVGEVPLFQTGSPYCASSALRVWGTWIEDLDATRRWLRLG